MDAKGVLRELDEVRRGSFSADSEGEILPDVTRARARDGSWHCIEYSRLEEASAERVIREQVAHYTALAVDVEWKLYSHDTPLDLRARLERAGFEVGARESVVVIDLAARPAWLAEPLRFRVLRATTAEHLREFERVACHHPAIGAASVMAALSRQLQAGTTDHLGYVAFDDGVPASIARLHTSATSAFGGLYGGFTLEAHRGRGLYRATIAERARDARRLGARYLRVDALPTSEPILERLGFTKVADTWPCLLAAGRSSRHDSPATGSIH
jgi:hypothetical protein